MKIDAYYQQQKCSPTIPVSSKIRLMQIFAGILRNGEGRQMRVGCSKKAILCFFDRYIFPTFTFKATVIILCYVVLRWLFNDTKIYAIK